MNIIKFALGVLHAAFEGIVSVLLMLVVIALIGLMLWVTPAHAGEWSAQYHFLSNHFADRGYEDWNETTEGFALRYRLDDTWAVQGGRYHNEFSVRSHAFNTDYIGVDYTPWHYGHFSFGGYGWATHGYEAHVLAGGGTAAYPSTVVASRDQGLLPAAGLLMRVEYGRFNYTLRAHTNLPGAVPAAVMSEVGWRFK